MKEKTLYKTTFTRGGISIERVVEEINLKKQFEEDFIPRVERMLEREKAHLNTLEMAYEKHGNIKLFGLNKDLKSAIDYSKFLISHFEQRIEEYKDYAQNL